MLFSRQNLFNLALLIQQIKKPKGDAKSQMLFVKNFTEVTHSSKVMQSFTSPMIKVPLKEYQKTASPAEARSRQMLKNTVHQAQEQIRESRNLKELKHLPREMPCN